MEGEIKVMMWNDENINFVILSHIPSSSSTPTGWKMDTGDQSWSYSLISESNYLEFMMFIAL